MRPILVISIILYGFKFYAQPSDATVKAKALSDGSKFVEFVGSGKVHSNVSETWYIRVVTTKKATEYTGVNYLSAKEYKYKKSGSSWKFDRTFHWWGKYEGIPNPTQAVAVALVKTDLKEFLGGAYGDIVGDIGEIKLAVNPKWDWHTVKSVSFLMTVTYNRKMNSTKVSKVKQVYKVRFYADKFKGTWKSFMSTNEGYSETISSKTYTSSEVNAMPTLLDMQYENEAKAVIASLPKVDIPTFKNSKEMIVYTHKMLRELSKDELHTYLLQTLTPYYFEENSKIVLNASGERKLTDVLTDVYGKKSSYKAQYCENPKVKHEQDGMMELWNKARDRKCRISIQKINGTYKLSDIEVSVFTQDVDIARVEASTLCGEPISTYVKPIVTFGVGDACEVSVRGYGWLKATVKQKDTSSDDKYYLEVDRNKSGWYRTGQMRPAKKQYTTTQKKSPPNAVSKSEENSTPQAFKVGDKIMGNWKNQGKWYPGTINEKLGNKYVVFYDDGDKETCTVKQLKLK